jgi:hypothetical protein
MLPRLSWNAAALSLLVPGWGQHEQARTVVGRLFLGWAVLAILIVAFGPAVGMPSVLGWGDLGLATIWSALDALFHDSARTVAA